MRTIALTFLVASASFAFAGESPKQAVVPAAIIPQASSGCPECLNYSGLFLGGGVEYLFDAETEYYNGRVGYEWTSGGNYSQSLFLEVGWLDSNEGSSLEAIPVTLNYEYKRALTRCLNFYIGGGVGVAFTDSDSESIDPNKPSSPPLVSSSDDTVFAVQAFAGLTYCITQSIELYGGVRYLWTDDPDNGSGLDDWSIGAGLRVKF